MAAFIFQKAPASQSHPPHLAFTAFSQLDDDGGEGAKWPGIVSIHPFLGFFPAVESEDRWIVGLYLTDDAEHIQMMNPGYDLESSQANGELFFSVGGGHFSGIVVAD